MKDVTYNGKAQTQAPTVKLGSTALKSGTDYTIAYKNNVNVGTASMTITGKGNYTGKATKSFKIKKANPSWKRLAGPLALDTMAKITTEFGKSDIAVVTTDAVFTDALAAAAFAGAHNAPIIMTNSYSLSSQARTELNKCGAKTVYIIGNTNDVSANVANQIKALKSVTTVNRISANGVSAKSIAIANNMKASRSDTVIIAGQIAFQDPLTFGSYAYASKSPIIYTEQNKSLSSAAVKHIKGNYKKAIIIGGPYTVPKSVETQLKNAGIPANKITRLAGSGSYEGSRIMAEWATGNLKNGTGGSGYYYYTSVKFQPDVKLGFNYVGVSQAKEGGWRDALCGAALCGKHKSAILLIDDRNSTLLSTLKQYKSQVAYGYIFGGTYSVPTWVENKIKEATR